MKPARLKQIALGTAFALSLTGCVSDDGTRVYNKGITLGQGTAIRPSDVESGLSQARAQRQSGDLDASAGTLTYLLVLAPDDPWVLGEYGKTMVAEGRGIEALAFLERAVALEPGEWSFHSAEGVAYDLSGDHLAAQAAYERALGMKPGEPTVLSNDALSHMEAGDLDTAERLLTEASRNDAADPRIKQNLAMIQGKRNANLALAANVIMEMVPPVSMDIEGTPMLMMTPAMMDAPAPATDPAPDMAPEAMPETPPPAPVAAADSEDDYAVAEFDQDQATRGQSIASEEPLVSGSSQLLPQHVEVTEVPPAKADKPKAASPAAKKTQVVAVKAAKPKAARKRPAPSADTVVSASAK